MNLVHFLLIFKMKKNLPTMQETWVQSLGWEDPLEKEMATHSLVAQTVKCLPTVRETGVQSLELKISRKISWRRKW